LSSFNSVDKLDGDLSDVSYSVDTNNSSWSPFSDGDKQELDDIQMGEINNTLSIKTTTTTTTTTISDKSIMYESMIEEMSLKEQKSMNECNGFLKFKDADKILKQRLILLKQMEQVHIRYNMSLRTWFLSVNIMDRIFRKCSISDFNCVLLGNTLIYIASKYFEEDSYHSVPDKLMSESNHFNLGFNLGVHIRRLEIDILAALNFEITVPTPLSMADVYLKYNFDNHKQYSQLQNKQLFTKQVYQLLRKTSFSSTFLTIKPSLIAQACIHATMMNIINNKT
jgi:hypothetical protein